MKKMILMVAGSLFTLLVGCVMFKSWQAIPPPGGCDQCHSTPIANNWTVAYQAPTLTNERDNKQSFQTERYNMPDKARPASSLEIRKVKDTKCFACH